MEQWLRWHVDSGSAGLRDWMRRVTQVAPEGNVDWPRFLEARYGVGYPPNGLCAQIADCRKDYVHLLRSDWATVVMVRDLVDEPVLLGTGTFDSFESVNQYLTSRD